LKGKIVDLIINTDEKTTNRYKVKYIPKQRKKQEEVKEIIQPLSQESLKLKALFNILECNKQTNHRYLQINYINDHKFDKLNFKQFVKYSCNNKNCLKCKSRKMNEYVKDRFLYSDNVYFITVSSTKEYDNIAQDDIKEFRLLISNVFDFLSFPYIASFEIGEKGLKMHSHIVVFNSNKKATYITDLIKLYTGMVTHGIIVKNDSNKLKTYMSKINKYLSKINKTPADGEGQQQIESENFLILPKNLYNILSLIDKKEVTGILKRINLIDIDKMATFSNYMDVIERSMLVTPIETKKQAFYQLLSFVWTTNIYKYNKVINLLKIKYKDDDLKYIKKVKLFNKKQLKIILKYMKYYLSLIDFFKDYIHNIEKIENDQIKINSMVFITSLFKKRISSNISIRHKRNETFIKEKSINILSKKEVKINLEFHSINDKQNLTKKLDIDKTIIDKYSKKEINIEYAIKNRNYRIESKIYNLIIKNSLNKKNDIIKHLNTQQKQILGLAIKHYAQNQAKKYKHRHLKKHCSKTQFKMDLLTEKQIINILKIESDKMIKDLIKKYEILYTDKDTRVKSLPYL